MKTVLVAFLIFPLILNAHMECDTESRDWKLQSIKSKFVFSAKVIGWKDQGRELKITKVFVGELPNTIKTLPDLFDVTYPNEFLENNQEYLFHAKDLTIDPGGDKAFHISFCSPPIKVSENKKIVKWLNSKKFVRKTN